MSSERLIGLILRPFAGDDKLRQSAEEEIRNRLGPTPESVAVLEAADALERSDRHPWRSRRWRVVLYVVTLLVSLPALLHVAGKLSRSAGLLKILPLSLDSFDPGSGEIAGLGPRERLLLYGDPSAASVSACWRPLWQSDPENQVYLAKAAAAYFEEHQQLPPEILAAADPDNGWFLAISAAGVAKGAVTRERLPQAAIEAGEAAVYVIEDERRLEEALELLAQAAQTPRFASHQNELLRQQIRLLPPRRDFVSQLPAIVFVAGADLRSMPLRELLNVLAAGAGKRAAEGDAAGFLKIVHSWKWLVTQTSNHSDTLIDYLVARVLFSAAAANFREAAELVGLEEEARYFARVHELHLAEKEARHGRDDPQDHLLESKASLLAKSGLAMLNRQVAVPPELTDDDLRPARYAEHAFFGRIVTGVAWLLLGLCVGFAAMGRWRGSVLDRRLSARVVDLLRPADWLWLMVGGVVLPICWYLAVTRLTPLTSREWSLGFHGFISPAGQFGALVLSLMTMPVVIAGRLLAKRGAVLGLCHRWKRLGWAAAVAALLAVAGFGVVQSRGAMTVSCCLLLLPAGWILGGLWIGFFGRASLRTATASRVALPAWVLAMLLLSFWVQVHDAEERHWIVRDWMGEITAEASAMCRYEWDITQIVRAELLEVMARAAEPPPGE
jgi:hypothetical protein